MFAARALALLQASAFCLALPHANISLAARRLQTPAPAPVSGEKCDLVACTCAGVSLKSLAAKGVVMSGPDAEGYSYQISFCAEIPAASLPQGCQQYAEKPAIVKYKADNKADCIEIGSIGPCSQGACGMTGVKTATGVDISYTYTYGCENIFKLVMTPGAAKAPTAVTSNECTYQATWAGLSAPPPPAGQVRCVNNTCVRAPAGVPGMDNKTCAAACGPLGRCTSSLVSNCAAARTKGGEPACMYCGGTHQSDLHAAGCTTGDIAAFCSAH